MDARTVGYVVLQGTKIIVSVRKINTSRYVAAFTGALDGKSERLDKIEKKLMKVHGAKGKLLDGKALPV